MTRFKLQKPLERAIHGGHPWVYRAALGDTAVAPGEEVTLLDRRGRFLARGISDAGPIALRIWTTARQPINQQLVQGRFEAAAALRHHIIPSETTAYRVVHGEGDRMPGVVCDRYGPYLVVKFDGAGAGALQSEVVAAANAQGFDNIVLRSGRGAEKHTEVLTGLADIPEELVVEEHGMRLPVSLQHGQKTGLFLDHRESRRRVRELSRGLRVLNLYGYTGGFSIAAGLGGAAHVTTVDSAKAAISLAERGFELNSLSHKTHRAVCSDVFDFLQDSDTNEPWSLIVSDPPSFAPNAKAVPRALASYEKLHKACIERLSPGGFLLCASCSSHITPADFLNTVRGVAKELKRPIQLLGSWGAAADHPTLPAFPEGYYLKALLLRIG